MTGRQAVTGDGYDVAACRSCTAPIVWARTTGDKAMPVDAAPVEDGNVELSRIGHRVIATVTNAPTLFGGPRRVAHFVTCPQAEQWRAKQ